MQLPIHPKWEKALEKEFMATYFDDLLKFLAEEYQQHNCYPPENMVFQVFNSCPLEKIKVVILGQDPYHGPDQAHGLSFSVPAGQKHPPSLVNIFKELTNDIGKAYPISGSLAAWVEQGVFY